MVQESTELNDAELGGCFARVGLDSQSLPWSGQEGSSWLPRFTVTVVMLRCAQVQESKDDDNRNTNADDKCLWIAVEDSCKTLKARADKLKAVEPAIEDDSI